MFGVLTVGVFGVYFAGGLLGLYKFNIQRFVLVA